VVTELERAGITVFERGWLSSNSVLLRGDPRAGAVVVDTGYWTHADQTVALLRHALAGEPLARVLNTHLHSDHCGGNAAIQNAFGCGVDVPSGSAVTVDVWDETTLTYTATGQHCPRFQRSGVLAAPGEVQIGQWRWEIISSPGHDPQSVALYQPDLRVLISADALWENGFGVVFPELEGESAFQDVRRTLEAFSLLDVRWVIPGHGAPFSDIKGAIARALRRLDSFVNDPRRHALHAAKVLIKFRLLEVQSESWPGLLAWLNKASYFGILHRRYFPAVEQEEWGRMLVDEMCRRGTLEQHAKRILNARA
jgi:glyoxylase-like metal-dependent hydrolase (beta-lactamase superfamily II)